MSDFQLLKNYQNHHQRQRHLKRRNKVLIGEALFACGAGGMGGVGEVGRGWWWSRDQGDQSFISMAAIGGVGNSEFAFQCSCIMKL